MSRTSIWAHFVLFLAKVIENVPQARVRVLNIVKVAPQVAMLGKDSVIGLQFQTTPYINLLCITELYLYVNALLSLVRRPAAGVDHWAPCLVHVHAELGVT